MALVASIGMSLLCVVACAQPSNDNPAVTVAAHVTFLKADQSPLQDVSVVVLGSIDKGPPYKSDATGLVTIVNLFAQQPDSFNVIVGHPQEAYINPGSPQQADIDLLHAVRDAHAFRAYYSMPAVPVQQGFSELTITVPDAVTLSGRIVPQGNAASPKRVVGRDDSPSAVDTDDQGNFTLGGIPKDAPSRLFVFDGWSQQVFSVAITAAQSHENGTISDITITPSACSISAHMTLDRSNLPPEPSIRSALSLIKRDGTVLMLFYLKQNGDAFNSSNTRQLPKVPDGEYYVVPGDWVLSGYASRVLDFVLAGRQAELDTANVPRMTAVAGQQAEIVVNGAAARSAVIQATGPRP